MDKTEIKTEDALLNELDRLKKMEETFDDFADLTDRLAITDRVVAVVEEIRLFNA